MNVIEIKHTHYTKNPPPWERSQDFVQEGLNICFFFQGVCGWSDLLGPEIHTYFTGTGVGGLAPIAPPDYASAPPHKNKT